MSTEASFLSAVAETEAAGVPVRLNDPDICCRSCYVVNDPREVWNLTQNGPLEWVDGSPVHSLEEEVSCTCTDDEYDDDDTLVFEGEQCDVCTGRTEGTEVVRTAAASEYFYFRAVKSAEVFAAALERNGLTVDWDGSGDTAVRVVF